MKFEALKEKLGSKKVTCPKCGVKGVKVSDALTVCPKCQERL